MGYLQGGWAWTFCQALAPGSARTWLSVSETWVLPGAGELGCYFHLHLGRREMPMGFQHRRAGGRSPRWQRTMGA